jgi:hypothetical protein
MKNTNFNDKDVVMSRSETLAYFSANLPDLLKLSDGYGRNQLHIRMYRMPNGKIGPYYKRLYSDSEFENDLIPVPVFAHPIADQESIFEFLQHFGLNEFDCQTVYEDAFPGDLKWTFNSTPIPYAPIRDWFRECAVASI